MQQKGLHPLYSSVMKTALFGGLAAGLVVVGLSASQAPSAARQTPAAAAPAPAPAAPTAPAATATGKTASAVETQNAVIQQYCTGCHNERGKSRAGELSLAGFDIGKLEDHAATAEKMIRKLRAGMMPPPGARRPDAETIAGLVNTFEGRLD